MEWDTLRFGDIDDNHVVHDADVEALKASFGRSLGEPKFNAQADFNSDQVVDGQDLLTHGPELLEPLSISVSHSLLTTGAINQTS